jgi:hypothetical protein
METNDPSAPPRIDIPVRSPWELEDQRGNRANTAQSEMIREPLDDTGINITISPDCRAAVETGHFSGAENVMLL